MLASTSTSAERWNIRGFLTYSVVFLAVLAAKRWAQIDLRAKDADGCEIPQYTVRTLSYDPLIQHIENFITPNEIKQLLELAKDNFYPSQVMHTNGSTSNSIQRTSWSALLHSTPKSPVPDCITHRASEFQGFTPHEDIEVLQLTRYHPGQFFNNHYDWLQAYDAWELSAEIRDRDTTFFATLQSDCQDCGTSFPLLRFNWTNEDERWCKFVECESEQLVVKPVPGSAVFWKNLHEDGRGDERVLHAGLPVNNGTKVGLNIWTVRTFEGGGDGIDVLESRPGY